MIWVDGTEDHSICKRIGLLPLGNLAVYCRNLCVWNNCKPDICIMQYTSTSLDHVPYLWALKSLVGVKVGIADGIRKLGKGGVKAGQGMGGDCNEGDGIR